MNQRSFYLIFSFLLFLPGTLLNAQETRSGWKYEVLREGQGAQLSRTKAAETHNRLMDANGRELISTYQVGTTDYQIIGKLSGPFQDACEVMKEGGQYRFYIPVKDFQAISKSRNSLNLPGEFLTWEVELLKILPALPDIAGIVQETMSKQGKEAAYRKFQQLSKNHAGKVYFGEWAVNRTGYLFLSEGAVNEAINVFEYNVLQNPYSANAHDSLAEAYYKAEKTAEAALHYRKSLQLNPNNANAKKMLMKIE